ncbi:family 43 glycosylhydrolase [Paenibacillus montaniterrae]|nr:family 43 glycosylhydrolase [Paenibacillus montaniterrae]
MRLYQLLLLWLLAGAVVIMAGCTKLEKPEVLPVNFETATYMNPLPALEEEWVDYGNGDPFVLRHNGQYYLYVSTKDHRTGIKAWTSDNLLDWRYVGLVADDHETTGAYAPEVVYWNGKFYMYTSPAGNGHYVYESHSPEGPFQKVTDNLGMSIDGSVFIDDDGSWYFTHAGTTGIVGVPMSSPTEFGLGQVIEGTFLGHWTEGSMIIKRNGLYYMTLTGNHVFSKGYRIHYAVSDQSPLGPYRMPQHNPIAISTEGDFYGLGHSSTVLGPDLDSYYLVYHNLLGRSAEGPPVRAMNIDRLVFNGSKMDLLGPTNVDQPAPRMPELASHLNKQVDEQLWRSERGEQGGKIVSVKETAPFFTAEYNFALEDLSEKGWLQFIFNYKGPDQYDAVMLLPHEHKLKVIRFMNGAETELAAQDFLPGMDLSALHTLRLVQHEHALQLYWDGLEQLKLAASGSGGAIGYRYEQLTPTLQYTAFSNTAAGSSDYDALKPIPGTIEAVHYLQGENRGFYTSNKNEHAPIRMADGITIQETGQGDYALLLQDSRDWVRYGINAAESGEYAVSIMSNLAHSEAELELIVDDEHSSRYKLERSAQNKHDEAVAWEKSRLGTIKLEQGYHTITVRAIKGSVLWSNMRFDAVDSSSFHIENLLESSTSEDVHGDWSFNEGWYSSSNEQQDVKLYGGSTRWSDYSIETKVRLGDDASGNAGILLRVTNESDFPHQVADALSGYYVAITPTKLELYKLNYDSVMLHAAKIKLPAGGDISLKVEAVAETITVYVAGEKVLSYTDPYAFMVGKVGLRSQFARSIALTDLSIKSLN